MTWSKKKSPKKYINENKKQKTEKEGEKDIQKTRQTKNLPRNTGANLHDQPSP